jgi:hypothetical protein
MSKKTLLNETTVRRFMKLANTQTLADNFVNEMGGYAPKAHEDEEEAPEDMGPMDEPMGDEPMDEPMDAMDADEPAADEPMDAMDDEPAADMGDDMDEVEISEDDRDVLAQAAEILSKIAGGGGADMGDMDMDMADDAGKMDAPMMEEEAVEEGMPAMKDDEDTMEEAKHDEEDPMEEAMDDKEGASALDEDQLVQEVTRRVAEKLRAAIKSRE